MMNEGNTGHCSRADAIQSDARVYDDEEDSLPSALEPLKTGSQDLHDCVRTITREERVALSSR